jgi:uncharacterized protein involved in outer membrane biogenesis
MPALACAMLPRIAMNPPLRLRQDGRIARTLAILAGALVGVVVLLLAAIALLDDSMIRNAVIEAAEARTGRNVEIGGLQIQPFSFSPRVRVTDVRVGNADWAQAEHLMTLDSADVAVSLPHLLLGRIVLPHVRLDSPHAFLERDREGRGNWSFDTDPEPSDAQRTLPAVRSFVVDDGYAELREAGAKSFLHLDVEHDAAEGELPIAAEARGEWRGAPLAIEARAGAVDDLFAGSRPYPLRIQAKSGRATFGYDGEMRPFDASQPFAGRISASGRDLWDLRDLAGVPLPHTKPYEVSAQLARREDGWHVTGLDAKVGRSDLRGDLSLTQRDGRPFLAVRAEARMLDLADLGGLVGAAPAQGTANPKPGEVVPEKPFDTARLTAFDADVSLKAQTLRQTANLPLDHLDFRAVLDRGRLTFDPLDFGVARGKVDATVRLDARKKVMAAQADVSFQRLRLAELLPRGDKTAGGVGAIDGRAKLASRGNAMDDLLGHLDGELGFVIRGGEMSNLLLEIAGLDAGEAVRFLVGGDRKVPIRCGVASFNAKSGVLTSDVLVLDTQDTKIGGEARIDLGKEEMRIDLFPQPKDPSIAVLRSPLHIKGTFAKPQVSVDRTAIAARAGAAILLGMVNPLLAVLPLIETGGGQDTDCNALVAEVAGKRDVGRSPKQ